LGTVDLIIEPARFGTLLNEAALWSERIELCLSAPSSDHGTDGVWSELLDAHAKYERVIVCGAEAAEGWLLHRLNETSLLRLVRSPSQRFEDQLLRFERGNGVQLFLVRTPLTSSSLSAEFCAIVHYRGDVTDQFAISFQRLAERWQQASRALTDGELDSVLTSAPKTSERVSATVKDAGAKPSAVSTASRNPPNCATGRDDPTVRLLVDVPVPVRALNWAERRGLKTLGDLLAWHPDAFAEEPNIGRHTVSETRLAVEAAIGREWEEVWGDLAQPKVPAPGTSETESDATVGPLPSSAQSRWNLRRSELGENQRALPLTRLALPSRIQGYCDQHRLQTVGELLAIPRDDLLAQPNLGRASLVQTLDALDEALHELNEPSHDDHLLSGWRRLLKRLPALQRMILVRRSGSFGSRETLESLGETLGLTRERVRQVEAACLDDLRRRSVLVEALQHRLNHVFAGRRCVPLELLLKDNPWWLGIEQHPDLVDYLFERILGGAAHRVVLQQRERVTTFFARFTQQDLHQAQEELLAGAERLPTPARLTDYNPLLEAAIGNLDPAMRKALQVVLEEQLNLDERDGECVLSFGSTKSDRIIALLAGQAQPIPVKAVFEALGRCRIPDEVLYFRRGLVGLEQHFPDFRSWRERLVPACIELMRELPAGRQWMVPELHETLREGGLVPEWLGHWHLASLLRRSAQVEYLGRLRVALPTNGTRQERIRHSDAVLAVLRGAGTPLSFEVIADRVRQQTAIQDGTLSLLLISSPFVKLDANLFGLVERDVSGGAQAIARAVEAVLETLASSGRGLTIHQAHQLATAMAREAWSPDLVLSLLRSEPQLRMSRAGHVGLASWDDLRAPSRGELIRQQVEKAGGRLALRSVEGMLFEVYGREIGRSDLSVECHRNGLELEQNSIVTREVAESANAPAFSSAQAQSRTSPDIAPLPEEPLAAGHSAQGPAARPSFAAPPPDSEPPVSATAAFVDLTGRVQGIPASARQHFEELLQSPLESRTALMDRARAHLADIEGASCHNEFIDLSLARALVERMDRLLQQVDGLSSTTRRIAHAAVHYFISPEDAEDDFDLGGLEDDAAVLSAVIAHLELS
jgi:sigma-70-like protein